MSHGECVEDTVGQVGAQGGVGGDDAVLQPVEVAPPGSEHYLGGDAVDGKLQGIHDVKCRLVGRRRDGGLNEYVDGVVGTYLYVAERCAAESVDIGAEHAAAFAGK